MPMAILFWIGNTHQQYLSKINFNFKGFVVATVPEIEK